MTTATKVCAKCGAKIFSDAPQEFCSACLLETGLGLLIDEPDHALPADTAQEFGMTVSAVRQASYRLRQRYRQVLRDEIAHTVMLPCDIDDELRHLITVLRG